MTRIALTRYSLPLDEQPHPFAIRGDDGEWLVWIDDVSQLVTLMEGVGAESVVIHGWGDRNALQVELYDPDNVLTEEPA